MTIVGQALMTTGLLALGTMAAGAGETIKVGIAVSLTGALAPYAESEGARCMADQVNKAAGPDDPKIKMLIEDNRSDAQLSVSLGQKFLDAGAQVITGLPFSDPTGGFFNEPQRAIRPLSDRARIRTCREREVRDGLGEDRLAR